MDNTNKKIVGAYGEREAINFLRNNNYTIYENNYIWSRMGEIDIIAGKNEYICFIEVKTRSSNLYGMPSEAVDIKKQDQIRKLANYYIIKKNLTEKNIRFDVIEVFIKRGMITERINHIKNAF